MSQCEYRLNVQHVIDRTRAFSSDRELMRYGTTSGSWGIIPSMHPSDTAPRARMDDSLTSQFVDRRFSFRMGRRTGNNVSWNTQERTSRAAAEHFLRFQSVRASFFMSSSSSSSESESLAAPLPPSSSPPCVLALWNRGLMSESLSGMFWSSMSL